MGSAAPVRTPRTKREYINPATMGRRLARGSHVGTPLGPVRGHGYGQGEAPGEAPSLRAQG